MYNRNKRSVCIDLKSEQGRDIARRLISKADVFIENFRPGAMDRAGFGYEELAKDNSGLLYYSRQGFSFRALRATHRAGRGGPDDGRIGVHDRPAGTAVTRRRFGHRRSRRHVRRHRHPVRPWKCAAAPVAGKRINSALFESTAFLVGQHMAQHAVTGEPAPPMPVRVSAWAIYDIFNCKDGKQVFVAVVSDTQWREIL